MASVAICFFGLTRSLQRTIDSIERNIFGVLRTHKIEYDVFVHTYDLNLLNNPRTEEVNCVLEPQSDLVLLKPTAFTISNQASFLATPEARTFSRYRGKWKQDVRTLQNLACQLHSLRTVTTLLQTYSDEHEHAYRAVLYLRPDLRYAQPLELSALRKVLVASDEHRKLLITPTWQLWNGLNDRFAFCSLAAAPLYANRLEDVRTFYPSATIFGSEMLLLFAAFRHGLELDFLKMRAIRVRAHGVEHRERWTEASKSQQELLIRKSLTRERQHCPPTELTSL